MTSLEEYSGARKKECEQHEQTWQPQVLVLGTDAAHIEQIFLLVDNTSYIMTSVLKAIDVCFKLTFVTNLNYAVECQSVWLFLQRALYNIETPYDKVTPRVNELSGSIKRCLE